MGNVGDKVWWMIQLALLGESEGDAEWSVCPVGVTWEESSQQYQSYHSNAGSKWKDKTKNNIGIKISREFTKKLQTYPRMVRGSFLKATYFQSGSD